MFLKNSKKDKYDLKKKSISLIDFLFCGYNSSVKTTLSLLFRLLIKNLNTKLTSKRKYNKTFNTYIF